MKPLKRASRVWAARAILIGECKWGANAVDRQAVRDLLKRTVPLTLADLPEGGAGWSVYLALFARAGATPAALAALRRTGCWWIWRCCLIT
jgi:hypothetical protein